MHQDGRLPAPVGHDSHPLLPQNAAACSQSVGASNSEVQQQQQEVPHVVQPNARVQEDAVMIHLHHASPAATALQQHLVCKCGPAVADFEMLSVLVLTGSHVFAPGTAAQAIKVLKSCNLATGMTEAAVTLDRNGSHTYSDAQL